MLSSIAFRILHKFQTIVRHSSSSLPWKPSASIIVAINTELTSTLANRFTIQPYSSRKFPQDFDILLFRRPESASTYGEKIVFPGGMLSEADAVKEHWRDLLNEQSVIDSGAKPQIYDDLMSCSTFNESELLHPSISLRLCAIRELFEETGLLLVEELDRHQKIHTSVLLLELTDLHYWQSRVMKDPEQFPRLYSHVDRKPPLDALKIWSNWLTPTRMDRRFDTVFYFAAVQSIISSSHASPYWVVKWQSSEVTQLFADKPPAFLAKQSDKPNSVCLYVPPQAYELGRLAQFDSLHALSSFALKRAELGCRRWLPMPLRVDSSSSEILVLPGDQRYTDDSESKLSFSAEELQSDAHRNRLSISSDSSQLWFDCTVHEFGHVSPISREQFLSRFGSL